MCKDFKLDEGLGHSSLDFLLEFERNCEGIFVLHRICI